MSKWTRAGIGIAVLGTALAVVFGIGHRKNEEIIEALQSESSVSAEALRMGSGDTQSSEGPVTDGVIYVVKNGLYPGMGDRESSVQKESAGAESQVSKEEVSETEPFPESGETITWNGETFKRNAHVKADLLIGVDGYDSADFLAVAAHDTSRNSIRILMIPRDAMMEMYATDTDGHVTPVVTHIKFAHAGQGTPNDKADRTADAVEALLCGTKINSCMSGEMTGIAEINDLVGGVPVIVPNDELRKADPSWKKGAQVILYGDEAEKFIRYRDITEEGTPLLRMDQHRAYISGFFNRLKEDHSLVGKVSDFVQKAVTTDMSKGEYEKVMLDGLSGGFDPQRDFMILPGKMTSGKEDGGTFDQYYVNYEEAIPLLLDLFYRKVG